LYRQIIYILVPYFLAISRLTNTIFLKVIIIPKSILWSKHFSQYKSCTRELKHVYMYAFEEQSINAYCTVTIEKAVKHIATSIIRKWPHRETFSASSSWRMNLWMKTRKIKSWRKQYFTGYQIYFNYVTLRFTSFLLRIRWQFK